MLQFLAALAILHQDELKIRLNCTHTGHIFNLSLSSRISDNLCLLFCINSSSMLCGGVGGGDAVRHPVDILSDALLGEG